MANLNYMNAVRKSTGESDGQQWLQFISHASVKAAQDLSRSSTQPGIALLQLFSAVLSVYCISHRTKELH
jgi:hypothetical protein